MKRRLAPSIHSRRKQIYHTQVKEAKPSTSELLQQLKQEKEEKQNEKE